MWGEYFLAFLTGLQKHSKDVSLLASLHSQVKEKCFVGYLRFLDYPPHCPHSISPDKANGGKPRSDNTQVKVSTGPCIEM